MMHSTFSDKILCRRTGGILAVILALALSLLLLPKLPKQALADFYVYSTAIYAREGELLRLTLAQDQQYRLWVPLREIPDSLRIGTLLYEDRWFYWHLGFDPLALLRSAYMTYVAGGHQGGSTISMQVVRQLYHLDSRSIAGKMTQIVYAIWLELRYSKAEILESYLNSAPYGGNITGVAAASLVYFHKPVQQLSLAEALTLAVIPQNPRQRFPNKNPQSTTLPRALQQARQLLWQRWLTAYPVDQRYAADFALPLSVFSRKDKPFVAPHLTDKLLHQNPYVQRIVTGIDFKTQQTMKRLLDNYLQQQHAAGINNAAVLLLDTQSMQVRALLGSGDYWNVAINGQVNGARAKRSPGSTLKPFIYALALQQGLVHPHSMLADLPTSFGGYNPENFDNRFLGPITVQDALIRSRNIPALTLAARLNNPTLYGLLQQAGIKGLAPESHYGLSLALGGGEVTMEELVQLYAALVNQGQWRPLQYDAEQAVDADTTLFNPASAFITLNMLSHNPRPDSKRPANPAVAWKTGTSWGFKDAWSVGVVGHYVLAVWVGNFSNAGHTAFIGIHSAAPLMFKLIDSLRAQQLLQGLEAPIPAFKPDNVTQVNVCAASGDLPNVDCPTLVKSWFIPGVSPIKMSTLHHAVYFDSNNRVVCKGQPYSRMEVFEFWSSEMAKLFAEAGMPRRAAPSLPSCYQLANTQVSELDIVSPTLASVYTLRLSKPTPIALRANSKRKGDIFWFANKNFLGKASSQESLPWLPDSPGKFMLRAINAAGQAASREVVIEQVP